MPETGEDHVYAARVRLIYRLMPVTLGVSWGIVLLTVAVLWPVLGGPGLVGWASVISALTACRLLIWRAYHRVPAAQCRNRRWAAASAGGALMAGLLWGGLGAWVAPLAQQHALFLAFVIGGLCASAVTVNSAHLPTLLAFLWPASLPLAVALGLEGSRLFVAMALMTFAFAVALTGVAVRFSATFGKTTRLQAALAARTAELDEANARLRAEMAEHRSTGDALRQSQKIEAIGRLTAGLAHDFNNLLTALTGMLDLLAARLAAQPEHAPRIEGMRRVIDRGSELTRQLLAFARKQKLSPQRTDLNALVRDVARLLGDMLGHKVTLVLDLPPTLPSVWLDPQAFEHAILNLAINARDAMPQGGKLTLATRPLELPQPRWPEHLRPGDYVVLTVADTGIGMTDEVLAKAVEPFFTTKPAGKGSGLGLSQVHGLVEQSGGATLIDSVPGQGTTIRLVLPTQNVAAPLMAGAVSR